MTHYRTSHFTFPLRLPYAVLTARADHLAVRRFLVPSIVGAVVLSTPTGSTAATPTLPPGWSHAEINVVVRHQPHTLIYDRGRVQAVTATSLTLLERGGVVVTVDVSDASKIRIAGRAATIADIRPREIATTLRIDGGAATKVNVQIPPALKRQFARQAKRQASAGGSS
jgi:hypothetical protein